MSQPAYTFKDDVKFADAQAESLSDIIREATKLSGKSPLKMVREWWSLSRGMGKISIKEYFEYQLYDDNLHSEESRRRFLKAFRFWPIVNQICDRTWQGTTEDKWVCENILAQNKLPVLKTIAICDKSHRSFGITLKLDTFQTLRDFLCQKASFPLFLKPVVGMRSSGAMIIRKIEDGQIILDHQEAIELNKFCKNMLNDDAYLIQSVAVNHKDISAFTPYLATVRFYNFIDDTGFMTPFSLIKIPSTTSIADNYWRPNNLLASLNPETGEILRTVMGHGVHMKMLNTHPETGTKITGTKLPFWEETVTLNKQCAELFSPLKFTSTDIAITQGGPVIVEINTGGSFELAQLATGIGFLQDDIIEFFARHGVELK